VKSNQESKMGLSVGFITGCMLGCELYEDEDVSFFLVDLLILRLIFYKDKE
jgi:hypothetical protein